MRFAVLAADVALFTLRDGELYLRLITVNRPPHFKNIPGLPGGLLAPSETAEAAAARHLEAKTGIRAKRVYREQLYTFSAVNRDPRGRVVAVAYLALVPWGRLSPNEQKDSGETYWRRLTDIRRLAYDHNEIVKAAMERLRSRSISTTMIGKLLPDEFTLTELERAYEAILNQNLDKRNFRKKILKLKILAPLPRKRTGGRFRPAQLYRFASPRVHEIEIL